jgi:hypothetical protein
MVDVRGYDYRADPLIIKLETPHTPIYHYGRSTIEFSAPLDLQSVSLHRRIRFRRPESGQNPGSPGHRFAGEPEHEVLAAQSALYCGFIPLARLQPVALRAPPSTYPRSESGPGRTSRHEMAAVGSNPCWSPKSSLLRVRARNQPKVHRKLGIRK